MPLDGLTRARLRQVHWREPWYERRWHGLALAVAVLLHMLFLLVIWGEMRPPMAVVQHVPPEEMLEVRFITHAPSAALQPPPALPPPARPRVPPKPSEPVAKDAMTMRLPTPQPTNALRLYDSSGEPMLPASASSAPTPGYVQSLPRGDTQIMQHSSPVKYQTTRFENDWSGNGNAVDNALQKLVDKTTVKKTIRLPGGVRIHCAVFLLAGGCGGDPPPPPSAKDGDERLSMAPAQSLAADPHAPKPPSIEACIAMYRAGKPLAWGCPVDTPNRAIDAELHERAAGAASHP